MHVACKLQLLGPLRELAAIRSRRPHIAVRVPKAHLYLGELHLVLIRELTDGRGIQCVERQAVRAGLDELGITGRISLVPVILLHRRRYRTCTLLPGEEERRDDYRDDGEDCEEPVDHVLAAVCRRASRSRSQISRTAPLPPDSRVTTRAAPRACGWASATAKGRATSCMSGTSGKSSPTHAHTLEVMPRRSRRRRNTASLSSTPWNTWRTPSSRHRLAVIVERRPEMTATVMPSFASSFSPNPSRTWKTLSAS